MPDTGWTLPSANTQEVSGPTVWSNPDRLHNLTDEATLSVGNLFTNEQRSWHNFGLDTGDIPSGATITGIEVEIYASGSAAHIADITLETGGSKGTTTHQINIGTTYTYFTVGGSSDMWGLANTSDSDFRSNGFKVHYQPDYTTGNSAFSYCRYVRVKVYYSDQPTGDGAITTGVVLVSGSGVVRATGLPVLPSPPEISLVGEDMQFGTGTSLTFTLPGDIEADDFALCVLKADSQTVITNTSAPAGWTALVDSEIHTGGRDRMSSIYYRKLDGTEITVEMTIDRSDQFSGTMTTFRGVDPNQPFDIAFQSTNDQNDENPPAPSITTLRDGSVVYTFHNFTHDDHSALGPPVNYTLTGGRVSNDFQHGGHAAAWRTIPTPQAVTPGVWTHTSNGSNVAEFSCYTMALRKDQTPVADVAARGDIGIPLTEVDGAGVVGGGVVGDGSISNQPLSVSGTAHRTVTGDGSIDNLPLDVSGAGDVFGITTGDGVITTLPLAVDGTADRVVAGAGDVSPAPLEVDGVGILPVYGDGAITHAPLEVDGVGTKIISGDGSLDPAPLEVDGAGIRGVIGTSNIVLAPLEVQGFGTLEDEIIGVGSIDVSEPTVDGDGERVAAGTGIITLGSLTLTGVGVRRITGDGPITLGPLTVDGSGTTGAILTGSGAITNAALTLAGIAERIISGSGDVAMQPLTLSGTGDVVGMFTGTGDITLSALEVAGIAERIINGSGVIILPATEVLGFDPGFSRGRVSIIDESENDYVLDPSHNAAPVVPSENRANLAFSQNMTIIAASKNFVILAPEDPNDVE